MSKGREISLMIVLDLSLVVIGVLVGGSINHAYNEKDKNSMNKILIKKGFAYYEAKTGEFKLKESCE